MNTNDKHLSLHGTEFTLQTRLARKNAKAKSNTCVVCCIPHCTYSQRLELYQYYQDDLLITNTCNTHYLNQTISGLQTCSVVKTMPIQYLLFFNEISFFTVLLVFIRDCAEVQTTNLLTYRLHDVINRLNLSAIINNKTGYVKYNKRNMNKT